CWLPGVRLARLLVARALPGPAAAPRPALPPRPGGRAGRRLRSARGSAMSDLRTVSIVINNYNYGRFLGEAIGSALGQTHRRTEVVVGDEGWPAPSLDVIAGYGGRVVAVLKSNGGQASAFNAGFAACRGEVVVFLDADDLLLPTAAEAALEAFRSPAVVK